MEFLLTAVRSWNVANFACKQLPIPKAEGYVSTERCPRTFQDILESVGTKRHRVLPKNCESRQSCKKNHCLHLRFPQFDKSSLKRELQRGGERRRRPYKYLFGSEEKGRERTYIRGTTNKLTRLCDQRILHYFVLLDLVDIDGVIN